MSKKYHNLYQILSKFDKLNSENIINDEDFDLIFNKTDFDSNLNRFIAEDEVSIIDNKETLGNLYIAEYLHDFVEYWKTIELSLIEKGWDRYQWRIYYDIKIGMIKILKNYSIYKGTENFIKFVYDLYAHLTTSDFINQEDFDIKSYCEIFSNFKNLEYNLKGVLPNFLWESVIKPTCHPAGWVCNYLGNEYQEDYDLFCYDNHLKNNYCYIDYSGSNTIINNKEKIDYNFDKMYIFQNDIIKNRKQNFQFDSFILTVGGNIIEIEESLL